MPKIVEIAGVNPSAPSLKDLKTELNQRAKTVQPLGFVDTSNLTEGEMSLYLLAQRDRMLAEFYQGTQAGAQYKAAFEQKRDALYKGLHQLGLDYAGLRLKSRPASGWLTWEEKGVTDLKGHRNLFEDAPQGVAVRGIGVIPNLDCDALYPNLNPADYPGRSWIFQENTNRAALREKCRVENLWRTALNQNSDWERTGNVIIYEWLLPSMIPGNLAPNSSFELGKKTSRHQYLMNTMVQASKISRANHRLWLENGCMAGSIAGANGQSLGPQLPVDYINALKQAGQERIGVLPGVLAVAIPIAIGIMALNFNRLKRFIGVVSGDVKLKEVIKAEVVDIQNFIKEYSDEILNLANQSDWKLPDLTNNPNNPDLPPDLPPDDGNFWDSLTREQKIGLGLLGAGGLWLVTR